MICWTRGRSDSILRAVNSRATSLRSRVWWGASISSMLALIGSPAPVAYGVVRQSLPSRWSARAARPSS